MGKRQKDCENYLERIPMRPEGLKWDVDEKNMVTLYIENKGFFHSLAQKLLKKPKVSQIHLDEMGSFLWPNLSPEKNIVMLGEEVRERFGEKAEPLYERLAKYFQILDSYQFITWKK